MTAHNQAIVHCKITKQIVNQPDCSSCLIALIAATHGVYNSVKIKKLYAASGENTIGKAVFKPLVEVDNNTANVLTTASLAVNPEIKAVATLQSLNPIGAKIGAINFPI